MRYFILLFVITNLLSAQYVRSIRIGTYPDEASAKTALKHLQKYAKSNTVITKLQKEYGFILKERVSGKYHITLAEPFYNKKVIHKVLKELRLKYPDAYIGKYYSPEALQTKKTSSPKTAEKIEEKLSKKIEDIPLAVIKQKPFDDEVKVVAKESGVMHVEKSQKAEETSISYEKIPQKTTSKKVTKEPIVKAKKVEAPKRVEKANINQIALKKEVSKESNGQLIAFALGFVPLLLILFFVVRYFQKRLEKENVQKMMLQEQLEQVNNKLKNKDKIFSHTSHELRNPMSAIIGLSQLLLEESMPQKQKDYVKKIEDAAKYLLEIINDILDLSKMEAGALKIEQKEFNLNHVLKHVVNIISVAARENGTHVELNVEHDVPPYIVGDALRLTQVLINLLNNAVKFTKNGIVILSIKKLEDHGNKLKLEFRIEDNGIGMTPNQLKKVFASYAQASASTAREFGGTGLGLSIVKELVEIMDGDIHVESKKQHGTTFIIHLKFHNFKANNKRFYRLPSKDFLNKKVLVVERSERNIQKIKNSFSYFNYTVHTIPSLNHVVLDEGMKFDIVVINKDIVDEKLINIIKKMKVKDKTKFILFSDSVLDVDKALLDKLEINEYLSRPFTQEDLLNVLKNVCTQKEQKTKVSKEDANNKEKLKTLGNKKILIAEDNKLNCKVLRSILSDTELELSFVEDGQAALDEVMQSRKPFDLIILDINMPKLNGYEVAKEIRKLARYNDTPILALTADVMQEAVDKSYAAGMQGHIAKPIIVNDFYKTLYDVLTAKK